MITRDEARTRPAHVRHSGANRRPSWCYGTAGIASALHLAALALDDAARRQVTEDALISAVTDPAQQGLVGDASLCHGYAGLARITARAATDANGSSANRLSALSVDLLDRALSQPACDGPGLLEGAAGVGLATLAAVTEPATGWDSCLLLA